MTVKCLFCKDTKIEPGFTGPCVWCEDLAAIAPKYEDVVAQRDAALGREAALREELARYQSLFAQAQKAIDRLNELHPKRMGELAKRLTVAEQLLRESLEEFKEGDDFIDRVIAALKPAAKPHKCIECESQYCHGVCVERGDDDERYKGADGEGS